MEKKTFVSLEKAREIMKTIPTPFHLYDEKGILENALTGNRGNILPSA